MSAWVAVSLAAFGITPEHRFDGVPVVLVIDAVPAAEMRGLKIRDDRGNEVYAKAIQNQRNRFIGFFGRARVPVSVHVTWKDHPTTVWGADGNLDFEGPTLGDYTVPVASRIPDEVLSDIRAHGGDLRLKFRIKPDGVLFGWDIDRPAAQAPQFTRAGGDFLDTRY